VSFDGSFAEPPVVVVLTPQGTDSSNDDPVAVVIKDVTTDGFKGAAVEPPAIEDGSHGSWKGQSINYFAVAKGTQHLGNDQVMIQAGTFSSTAWACSECSSLSWQKVSFPSQFSSIPAILAGVQTSNNVPNYVPKQGAPGIDVWMQTAVKSTSKKDVQIMIERGKTAGKKDTALSKAEDIGWIAVETVNTATVTSLDGSTVEFFSSVSSAKVQGWNGKAAGYNLNFPGQQKLGSFPTVVASKNTRNGGHGGWLRMKSTQADAAYVCIDETSKNGNDRKHPQEEKIGMVAASDNFEVNTAS